MWFQQVIKRIVFNYTGFNHLNGFGDKSERSVIGKPFNFISETK
ncbi:hypothetical protein ADICYQ_3151 [Cyclobacterium qasimii M12-11B]|uniref:Uncharacterized protein n=1 Tax=Cyclobacterium qasimii M12-11B TaxID=641524 RepID=S7VBZ6_9BACT|nr:hypothetical protein ADICYQ_3151 [Cyclobacterium qasimii M12-11B]